MTRQHAFRPAGKPKNVVPIVPMRPRTANPTKWIHDVSRYFQEHLEEEEQDRFRLNVEGVMDSIDAEAAKRFYLSQLLVAGPHSVASQLRSGFIRKHLEGRAIREAAACIEAQVSFEQMEKCRKRLEKLDKGARMGASRDALKAAVHACEGDAVATTKRVIVAVWQAKSLHNDLKMDRVAPHRRAAILSASEIFMLSLQRAAGFES